MQRGSTSLISESDDFPHLGRLRNIFLLVRLEQFDGAGHRGMSGIDVAQYLRFGG